MFTRLAFPMKARNFDQSTYRHWFHIAEVGGAMLVAIIPPIAVVSASEYNVPSFPANYCVPEPRVAYYTELLPINIILGAGVCLIVTIFWMLHQVRSLCACMYSHITADGLNKWLLYYFCSVMGFLKHPLLKGKESATY